MTCPECGKRPVADNHDTCFPCHVRGVSFTFAGGGGYGQKTFHERTNQEFINEFVPQGPGIEPADRGVWS